MQRANMAPPPIRVHTMQDMPPAEVLREGARARGVAIRPSLPLEPIRPVPVATIAAVSAERQSARSPDPSCSGKAVRQACAGAAVAGEAESQRWARSKARTGSSRSVGECSAAGGGGDCNGGGAESNPRSPDACNGCNGCSPGRALSLPMLPAIDATPMQPMQASHSRSSLQGSMYKGSSTVFGSGSGYGKAGRQGSVGDFAQWLLTKNAPARRRPQVVRVDGV